MRGVVERGSPRGGAPSHAAHPGKGDAIPWTRRTPSARA